MTTRVLLNVDFYRNLLVDDPARFLDSMVMGGDFFDALSDDILYLKSGIEERIADADEKDWDLLNAKLFVALGMSDLVTDEMRSTFSSSEDPIIEELSSMNSNPLDPIQREGVRELFTAPKRSESAPTERKKLINMCYLMKLHKRLIDLIERTPILNAGWNLINPNQPSNSIPLLGFHATPADDNNSNCSHSH